MSQIVPQYPQNHAFMSELARYAETELVEYKGQPYIPAVPVIALFMDDESKRKGKQRSSPKKYWENIKRAAKNDEFQLPSPIVQLKIPARDGKRYRTDCINTLTVKRILMYIRDRKPEGLRIELLERSDKFLTYTQQNLFEGRPAFENEFHNRTLPMFTDRDDAFTDLGYNR